MSKTTTKTTTKKNKTTRTVAKLTSGDRQMSISLSGTRLSASVLADGKRERGNAVKHSTVEEARAAFDATIAKAESAGWSRVRKTVSIDELIGLSE